MDALLKLYRWLWKWSKKNVRFTVDVEHKLLTLFWKIYILYFSIAFYIYLVWLSQPTDSGCIRRPPKLHL